MYVRRDIDHVTDETRALTTLHITTAPRSGGRPRPPLPHGQSWHQLPLHGSPERAPCSSGGECVCRSVV